MRFLAEKRTLSLICSASRFRERPLRKNTAGTTVRCLLSKTSADTVRFFFLSRIFVQRRFLEPRSRAKWRSGLDLSHYCDGQCFTMCWRCSLLRGRKTASNVSKLENSMSQKTHRNNRLTLNVTKPSAHAESDARNGKVKVYLFLFFIFIRKN